MKFELTESIIGDKLIDTVSARDIWREVGSKKQFSDWIKLRIRQGGFIDGLDFITIQGKSSGGRALREYHVSIDMGKHLGMMERNENGKIIRQHFIDIEKNPDNILTMQKTASLFPALSVAFAAIGIEGNQLALAVDKSAKNVTGISLLELGSIKLISPVQEHSLPPSGIGKEIDLSGKAINLLLTAKGYQTAHRDHKDKLYYKQTEEGKPFSEFVDTGKKHGDGTPVKQLKWYSSIINLLKED